jgi:SAM-dependent methyltransferase
LTGTDRGRGEPRYLDRFTGRASDYSRYRPGYPQGIISYLEARIGFNQKWVVADIGSGTGILSELFLKNGNKVFCVEPNQDMRLIAVRNLRKYRPHFVSVKGSAEDTGMNSRSVDLIVVGQALHWFDLRAARLEFRRILRKDGSVAVIYNHRRKGERMAAAYGKLVAKYGRNRAPVPDVDDAYVSRFLGNRDHKTAVFHNSQTLDLKGVLGRLASASYMPARNSPRWINIEKDARKLIRDNGADGAVRLHYDTSMYLGSFN